MLTSIFAVLLMLSMYGKVSKYGSFLVFQLVMVYFHAPIWYAFLLPKLYGTFSRFPKASQIAVPKLIVAQGIMNIMQEPNNISYHLKNK